MTAIEIENLSKQYTLGTIGSGTLWRDMNVWWAQMRGKPNPYLKIGQTNDRTQKAEGDYVWALRDINLKIEEGDVVGIIGSNGAGKSTLLKILSRVTTPTTGRITTYGRIASLLEVGTGFHQEMTGRENIYMNGAIMGMTRAEITHKLDEIVEFAGVAKYIDTPVKRYSSGMTVRLGFAVAAFLEPEILVVDEVLAVGDAEFQNKAIGKMKQVSTNEGRTVLFVSHNMAAVSGLCRSGVVLKNGMINYCGTIEEAINRYTSVSSAQTGELIINRIKNLPPFLKITKVSFNGTMQVQSTILHNQSFVEIELSGYTSETIKADLMVRFCTINGLPQATFATGQYMGDVQTLSAGNFSIKKRIKLPRYLSKGDYAIDICMHQPYVCWYFKSKHCADVHVEGSMDYYCHSLNVEDSGFCGMEPY